MLPFFKEPLRVISSDKKEIYVFEIQNQNIDQKTVEAFGEEWKKFSSFDEKELEQIGNDYFDILPESLKNKTAVVLDAGCGAGRWAAYLAPIVKFIECIDPSDAVYSASRLLGKTENVRISRVDIDNLPFQDGSFDLVYSLGVLHHIPNTFEAMKQCVKKVKPGGYFLVYLYYNLDNRGYLYKIIFNGSNIVRKGISKMPADVKKFVCDAIAAAVYFPLAKTAGFVKKLGLKTAAKQMPLSYYSDKSFWVMKNDALDRFGTPLEQRFSKKQIQKMMEDCGLNEIIFSGKEPYWHAIGKKQ